MNVIAVDPGRDKCGIAVLAAPKSVLMQQVIATSDLVTVVRELATDYDAAELVIGNGTTSREARERLAAGVPAVHINVRGEYRTTDMARARYFRDHPPRGLRRLLPTSMQVPPVPVDDYAAVILGERFLAEGESKDE